MLFKYVSRKLIQILDLLSCLTNILKDKVRCTKQISAMYSFLQFKSLCRIIISDII